MRVHEIFEHQMDNVNGWGAVSDNRNVDYLGLRVSMRPSTFLKLAAPLGEPISVKSMIKHVEDGGHLASPFLLITIPPEWEEGDLSRPARVTGHEGRNRMVALANLEGSQHQEVHIFPTGGFRNRHLTPDWVSRLNSQLFPEREDNPINGPFWRR